MNTNQFENYLRATYPDFILSQNETDIDYVISSEKNKENTFNVLVVCSVTSDRRITDYDESEQFISDNFYSEDKQVRTTFLDGIDKGTKFPHDVIDTKYNNYFDIIWFAGCNRLEWIFNSKEFVNDSNQQINPRYSIQRAYDILKDTGVVIFTEIYGHKKQKTDRTLLSNWTKNITDMYLGPEIYNINEKGEDKNEEEIKNDTKERDDLILVFKEFFEEEPSSDQIISYKKKEINFSTSSSNASIKNADNFRIGKNKRSGKSSSERCEQNNNALVTNLGVSMGMSSSSSSSNRPNNMTSTVYTSSSIRNSKPEKTFSEFLDDEG